MFFVAVLIAAFIVANVIFWVSYSVHRGMVKMETPDKYANGNFSQFISEFANRSWERKDGWRQSYFGIGNEYYTNKIHADIIKFSGVGMILDPISYFRFKIWSYKNAIPMPNNSKEYKGYWSKKHE